MHTGTDWEVQQRGKGRRGKEEEEEDDEDEEEEAVGLKTTMVMKNGVEEEMMKLMRS